MISTAVVSDMDGLLLDTERLSLRCWLMAADELKQPFSEEIFQKMVGRSAASNEAFVKGVLGSDFPYWDVRALRVEKMDEIVANSGVPLKEGAKELLVALKEKDIPVAVATSTHYEVAKTLLSNVGIYELLDGLVGSDQVENGKPAPDLFLAGAKLLNTDPASCLVFEDSPAGCHAGIAAGAKVLAVPDLALLEDSLKNAVHGVYDSLHEVREESFKLLGLAPK